MNYSPRIGMKARSEYVALHGIVTSEQERARLEEHRVEQLRNYKATRN